MNWVILHRNEELRNRPTGGKERTDMMRKALLRAFFALMIVSGFGLGLAGLPVAAHADVESSVPAADSTVSQSPATVEIIFSSEVGDGTAIDVVGSDGVSVAAGEAVIDLNDPNRERVTVALNADLPAGVYTVNWTSASTDGHTESGSFSFTVSGAATASPEASPSASPDASPAAMVGGAVQTEDEVKEEMHVVADNAQQQATIEAAETDGLDEGQFLLGVGVGAAAAFLIYLFWRMVRPSPEERVQP